MKPNEEKLKKIIEDTFGKESVVAELWNDHLKELEALRAQNLKQPNVSSNEAIQLKNKKESEVAVCPRCKESHYIISFIDKRKCGKCLHTWWAN